MLRVNKNFIWFIKMRFVHVNSDYHQHIYLLRPQILVLPLTNLETLTVDYICFQMVPQFGQFWWSGLDITSPACPHWQRSILYLCRICTSSTRGKNRWSILVPCKTSPIFNQFTSGLLHSFLHLRIYDIKQLYELIC